jgi:hypothetical protein
MKVSIDELRKIVGEVVSEAKKKKEKSDELKYTAHPKEYGYAESLDFSAPLGGYNLYRSQGAANWGPYTGAGPKIDDNVRIDPVSTSLTEEKMLRSLLRSIIGETLMPRSSAWDVISESSRVRRTGNVWEDVARWYDHQGFGLGSQTPAGIMERKRKAARRKRAV